MATHRFTPSHYHRTIGSHKPVLRIADGDTVITATVDALGQDAAGQQIEHAVSVGRVLRDVVHHIVHRRRGRVSRLVERTGEIVCVAIGGGRDML